ncbi:MULTISPECIES: ABC transporter substrate-binding protein [Planktothrix]|uniref:Sugar ABC transporter solute-binding protein n=3 Tax=Planktothrix TaxID=54304 RepID=A0A4P6A107_PLAAG|nr:MULTISPECIES: ABC transporter substrate-binding protein [Planktothrix]GDZ94707.1 sugar ABC transporter solute-binding protein [Planktothrix agardhii CCAP 1459/11A]CAC5340424.1 Sugar ABC transporter solute-binding protein [Planktothrix rubescens NIVA-CYA 18]CAD5942290.1 Trehalose/maltose-binding protein MalE [Planktothrix rubescens NIVA-CYA 18]CAH2572534.1 Trehalose/maltose-binding protein MalE [Planktothrix rubescens]
MIFVKFKIPLFYKFILTSLIGVIISILMIKPAFTQQPVTLKVLVQALESTQWQPIINSFHQTHPKIRLEVVKAPNNSNLVEDLYTSAYLLGDSPYDLVYMDVVWVQKFAAAGWLEDLTKKVDPQKLTDYIQGDVQGGKYQNKLYRMPFRTDVGMLYYRTDLLEKAGLKPPKTFQDLLTTSQTLQDQNLAQWGYVWQGKQYEGLAAMFTEILQGYGGFWVNPETQAIGLDAPESIEAVKFLRQTIKQGISPPGVTTYAEEETRRLFESGNTVFLRNWPYVYALASNSPIAGKYGIQPMVHLPGKQSGACLGGWGFGISKSSKHQREAWQVIQYFNQPDIQRQYFLETGYVPSRKSLFTDDTLVAKYNYLPALLQGAENAVLRPPIPQYAQVSDILQRYLSAALTGSKTPEAAMKAAAGETRTLLNIN